MPHAILTFGFHDRKSPRYITIRKHYEKRGKAIIDCHTEAQGFLPKCRELVREFRKHRKSCRTVVVTFPGHHLVWLAWLLTRYPRKTLVFDAFVSAYDTLVSDRRKIHPWNPAAWAVWLLDFADCHLADEILIDTKAHRDYFCRMFRVHPADITVVYLEAPLELFHVDPHHKHMRKKTFEVLFYGSYIPLQGIDTILKAAAMLQHQHASVHFTIVGGGQTYADMRLLATEWKLQNVSFTPFVPLTQIPPLIHDADVCLGIFGTGDKTMRVIPHKVIECMACGVPVITADTPAIHERYKDGEGIHLVPPGDAHALAGKIVELQGKTLNRSSYQKDHPHYRGLEIDAALRLIEPDLRYAVESLSWIESNDVIQYMGADFPHPSLMQEQERLKEILNNKDEYSWMIESNGKVIGNVCINSISETSKKFGGRVGNLTVLIGSKDHWGKGMGTRVCTTVLDWAFKEGKFVAMAARALQENVASIKTLQKLGFAEMDSEPFDGLVKGKKSMWRNFTLEKTR